MRELEQTELNQVCGGETDGGCVQNPNDLQPQPGESYYDYLIRTRMES